MAGAPAVPASQGGLQSLSSAELRSFSTGVHVQQLCLGWEFPLWRAFTLAVPALATSLGGSLLPQLKAEGAPPATPQPLMLTRKCVPLI